MLRVRFYDEESTGTIVYYPKTKELRVTHSNGKIRDRVRKYLTSKRRFNTSLPNTREVGVQLIVATPTDSIELMDLALCDMNSSIGFWVDWSDSEGGSTADIRTSEDTGILKSVDDKVSYRIINHL